MRHTAIPGGFPYSLQVGSSVREQIYLSELHSEVLERARALPGDHALHGVVGLPGHGEQQVARAQYSEKRRGQRVGPVDEIVTDEGVLRAEDLRKYRVELVPAIVAVAVAVSALHVDIADLVVDERL